MDLSIDIAIEHDSLTSVGDIDTLVHQAVEAALLEAKASFAAGLELSLVLCDDAFIQKLNRDWRGKDKPTNVLSFPADPAARGLTLGDIVVAYETTAHEAEAGHRSLLDHLTHLVVHGVLHLIGYDHESDRDAELMERLEVLALRRLGIASPYEDMACLSGSP